MRGRSLGGWWCGYLPIICGPSRAKRLEKLLNGWAPILGAVRPRKFAGFFAFLPPALLALGLVVNGAVRASNRHGNEATSIASAQLKKDLATVPFTVRLPKVLPANAPLIRVFLDKPDYSKGYQAFALNTWYSVGDPTGPGRVIHVWQTNDNFLARSLQDPTQRKGAEEHVAGGAWNRVVDRRVRGHAVTVFSRRFDDGITMTVDAQDPADIRATIGALVPRSGTGPVTTLPPKH